MPSADHWADLPPPPGAHLSVCELAQLWLRRDPLKRPTTLARDESVLRLHITPALGAFEVGEVAPAHVQQLVNNWCVALSPRTVARQYVTVQSIFTYAVLLCEWIERSPVPRDPPAQAPAARPPRGHP